MAWFGARRSDECLRVFLARDVCLDHDCAFAAAQPQLIRTGKHELALRWVWLLFHLTQIHREGTRLASNLDYFGHATFPRSPVGRDAGSIEFERGFLDAANLESLLLCPKQSVSMVDGTVYG